MLTRLVRKQIQNGVLEGALLQELLLLFRPPQKRVILEIRLLESIVGRGHMALEFYIAGLRADPSH